MCDALYVLALETLHRGQLHGVREHHTQSLRVRVHSGRVVAVAMRIGEPIADAGDGNDDGAIACSKVVLLHEAREARRFRPAAHANALHARPVDLQAIAGTLEVWPSVAHAMPDVYAVDGRIGEDAVHQLGGDHDMRVGERRAVHRRGEVLDEVCDDDDVALTDVVPHAAGRRRDDQLPDA